ncbi:hypothetical protein [Mycobacterium asiaticum]|uniref:hypothetical protein n=1 Tax=Mycobacterium asiaticum TaxID=1790 RepID=UPI0012DB6F45|nr:hypothetical protein [Mycobacterium asiaticum]
MTNSAVVHRDSRDCEMNNFELAFTEQVKAKACVFLNAIAHRSGIPLRSQCLLRTLPLPANIRRQFGENADVEAVDQHVRGIIQNALDEMSRQRRFPFFG